MIKNKDQSTAYHLDYAQLYDVLTLHKDYVAEVGYLERRILSKVSTHSLRILSIGCGTGSHESILSGGHRITGLDTSLAMITLARRKNNSGEIQYLHKDISDFDQDGYDVALSLFNVVNCLNSIEDLILFFSNISKSLKPKGVFFFECWNGITCMLNPPIVVERNFDLKGFKRTAIPQLDATRQKLSITYQITGNLNGQLGSIESVHNITLFTQMEIEFALIKAGFTVTGLYTDLANGLLAVSEKDRMISFVCQKAD